MCVSPRRARVGRSIGRCTTSGALSTALHERFGVVPHVVEAILGHVGVYKAGVRGVYNKALYLDERRRGLERWGEHITALVSGKAAKAEIVNLRRPKRA